MFVVLILLFVRSVVYTANGKASVGVPEVMPSMLLDNKYKEPVGNLPKRPLNEPEILKNGQEKFCSSQAKGTEENLGRVKQAAKATNRRLDRDW